MGILSNAFSDEKITLKVTQASLNQTAMDFPRNMANIYEAIRVAASEGSDILAFEELALTGYEANDDFEKTDNKKILALLDDIAAYAKELDENLIISIGHPWRFAHRDYAYADEDEATKDALYNRLGKPFNVQTVITGGTIHAMTAKSHLYNDGRGYEGRYFQEWSMASANKIPGSKFGTIQIPRGDDKYKDERNHILFGKPILNFNDGKKSFNLAQAICEEKWVASRYDGAPHDYSRYERDNFIPAIARQIGSKDGFVLVLPNASPPESKKLEKHHDLAAKASQYADVVIDTDGIGSSGSTFAQMGHRFIAQDRQIIANAPRLTFNRVATSTHIVEINAAPEDTFEKSHRSVAHNFADHSLDISLQEIGKMYEGWDRSDNEHRHAEEAIRMTALWLYDYMQKTKAQGIAEALSGGADSCFNSVIVAAMVRLAIADLGVEGFCKDMRHLKYADKIMDAYKTGGDEAAIETCLEHMLTGVYMGTQNSSKQTDFAAELLMQGGVDPQTGQHEKGIGGKFMRRNVQDLLDFYGTIFALEDSTQLDDERFNELRSELAEILNLAPGSITLEELEARKEKLKAKYPEVDDIISAADPNDGVAYENIQARGRQVLIMLIANKEGKMAVVNPNLDEARNAYATFGGDLHSGTINLNAHLPKAYQLQLMQYLYEHGLQGAMGPVRSLGAVLKNKPSAELQPKNDKGEVVQHDEDALKGSFEQLDRVAHFMLKRTEDTPYGARRKNASEILEACEKDELFKGLKKADLFDMIMFRYRRWAVAQHKIHASPIGPTFGNNVDHQTSLRTPNLSGEGRFELVELGIDIMCEWAKDDKLNWSDEDIAILKKRAIQDEHFVEVFEKNLWNPKSDYDFDLPDMYDRIKLAGNFDIFPKLAEDHPISIISKPKVS